MDASLEEEIFRRGVRVSTTASRTEGAVQGPPGRHAGSWEGAMSVTLEVKGASKVRAGEQVAGERRRVLEVLLKERRQIIQVPPATSAGGPDPLDQANEREEEAVWLAVLDRSRDVQTAVEEALRRLVTGEYGLCMECGQHIALARLRALPFAVRCLTCQERFEQEAKRRDSEPLARTHPEDALPE